MKILIFAGAGTSVELGVPAMHGMAVEFLEHAERWHVEFDLAQKLMGVERDIEALIERLDQICSARLSLESLAIATAEIVRLDTLRAEVEWFVQHAAERIAARDAHFVWGPTLRLAARHEFTLVTTNYDRGIELAANYEGVVLNDGFLSFGDAESAHWEGFQASSVSTKLIKLHGSTDWYAESESGNPRKLRHPMPLFGRASLRLPSGQSLASALVLPSREKILTRQPYPRLQQAFLNALDASEVAVFVGSSLRDAHIKAAAQSVASTRPVFVVNPQGDSCGVTGARVVQSTASVFLSLLLPRALLSPDPVKSLAEIPEVKIGNLLACMRSLTDPQDDPVRRCRAIEQLDALDDVHVCIDSKQVSSLLSDQSADVARYALGLVASSPHFSDLLAIAKASIHGANAQYAEELALLEAGA